MLTYIISVILKIFFCIFYLKCFSRKQKKIWNFYSVVKKMNVTRMIKNKKIVAASLMVFDISVPIYFILFRRLHIYYLIVILLIQLLYLLEMMITKSPKQDENCNCYIINLPREVSFSSVLSNLLVSYVFILIFIFDNIQLIH